MFELVRVAPKGPVGVRKRKSPTQTKSIESLADLGALEVLDTYTTAFFFRSIFALWIQNNALKLQSVFPSHTMHNTLAKLLLLQATITAGCTIIETMFVSDAKRASAQAWWSDGTMWSNCYPNGVKATWERQWHVTESPAFITTFTVKHQLGEKPYYITEISYSVWTVWLTGRKATLADHRYISIDLFLLIRKLSF